MLRKILTIIAKIIKESIKICFIILIFFCLFLSLVLKPATDWAKANYNYSSFDEILYTLGTSVTAASEEVLDEFLSTIIYPALFDVFMIFSVFIVFWLIYKFLFRNSSAILNIKICKKNMFITLNFFTIIIFIITIIIGSLLHTATAYTIDQLYIDEYLETSTQSSNFFKQEYINPKDVNLEFPKKKRNLIYIYLESMESTYTDKKHGGAYSINYIPELTQLAEDNINFSSNHLIGGAYMPYGASWTMGAMVAQTAGIPIKTPFIVKYDENKKINYENGLVNGAYSLGEILENEGYNQAIMVGSDLSFGGRKVYFKEHGNYKTFDLYTAKKDNIIPDDYYVFWGYEDEKLFAYAKQEIISLSQQEKPFNFTMLTVDTHAPDGYTSDICENQYDNPYLNAVACSSKQLGKFIKWIQEQDFYEDTTIILTGDHLSMNIYSFENIDKDYQRSIYNVYINSAIDEDKINTKNRQFTSFDY